MQVEIQTKNTSSSTEKSDQGFDPSNPLNLIHYPAVKIEEEDDRYFLKMEIPEYTLEDVRISTSNNTLKIRKIPFKGVHYIGDTNGNLFHNCEIYRDISFEDKISGDNIQKKYCDGVLCLEVQKELIKSESLASAI